MVYVLNSFIVVMFILILRFIYFIFAFYLYASKYYIEEREEYLSLRRFRQLHLKEYLTDKNPDGIDDTRYIYLFNKERISIKTAGAFFICGVCFFLAYGFYLASGPIGFVTSICFTFPIFYYLFLRKRK